MDITQFANIYRRWALPQRTAHIKTYDSCLGQRIGIGRQEFVGLRDRVIRQCREQLADDPHFEHKMRTIEAKHLRSPASGGLWDWECGWGSRTEGNIRETNGRYGRIQSRKFA